MSLSAKEISQLRKLVSIAEKIITAAAAPKAGRPAKPSSNKPAKSKRVRRSGNELAAFRKMLLTERKKGVAVAELASKHGISAAYIYQL